MVYSALAHRIQCIGKLGWLTPKPPTLAYFFLRFYSLRSLGLPSFDLNISDKKSMMLFLCPRENHTTVFTLHIQSSLSKPTELWAPASV